MVDRLAVAAGILVGGLVGVVNGLVITRLSVVPFIATLGMLGVARGVAKWLAGSADSQHAGHVGQRSAGDVSEAIVAARRAGRVDRDRARGLGGDRAAKHGFWSPRVCARFE